MKMLIIVVLMFCGLQGVSQSLNKIPDSVRRKMNDRGGAAAPAIAKPAYIMNAADSEELLKNKLLKLALKNAEITTANANIEIAEINRKKANSTLLSSVNLGANANEFVINNSPAASFYPKYNIGFTMPLDIFAKTKAEKRTGDQNIIISKAQKQLVEQDIKLRLLIQYETYKEKKALVELQKIAMEDDIAAYERAQRDFKDEVISLEDLNKIYKASIFEKALLATKEKDLRIAIIQLETLIGIPLQKALTM